MFACQRHNLAKSAAAAQMALGDRTVGLALFVPILLLIAVHADMRLRGSRHFAAGNDQLRASQLRSKLPPPPQMETETLVEPLSNEDIARMVARRKALLGPAIGLRRDVVADNLP